MNGSSEFFGELENEHNLSRELSSDRGRALILNGLGYQRDMLGNRRSLFTSEAIAEQLANLPDSHPSSPSAPIAQI